MPTENRYMASKYAPLATDRGKYMKAIRRASGLFLEFHSTSIGASHASTPYSAQVPRVYPPIVGFKSRTTRRLVKDFFGEGFEKSREGSAPVVLS